MAESRLYRYLAVDLLCLQVLSHLLQASGDAVEGVKGPWVRRTKQPVAPWRHQANASGQDEHARHAAVSYFTQQVQILSRCRPQ